MRARPGEWREGGGWVGAGGHHGALGPLYLHKRTNKVLFPCLKRLRLTHPRRLKASVDPYPSKRIDFHGFNVLYSVFPR